MLLCYCILPTLLFWLFFLFGGGFFLNFFFLGFFWGVLVLGFWGLRSTLFDKSKTFLYFLLVFNSKVFIMMLVVISIYSLTALLIYFWSTFDHRLIYISYFASVYLSFWYLLIQVEHLNFDWFVFNILVWMCC